MKIDSECLRQNCSPLNVLFSGIDYVDISWRSAARGVKQGRGGKKGIFELNCVNISKTVGDTSN